MIYKNCILYQLSLHIYNKNISLPHIIKIPGVVFLSFLSFVFERPIDISNMSTAPSSRDPLPPGWEEVYDEQYKTYYYYAASSLYSSIDGIAIGSMLLMMSSYLHSVLNGFHGNPACAHSGVFRIWCADPKCWLFTVAHYDKNKSLLVAQLRAV